MSESEKTPLHPLEQRVLTALKGSQSVDFDSLVKSSGLGPDQVRRALSWLTSKKLVEANEEVSKRLLLEAEPVELLLIQSVDEGGTPMSKLRSSFKSNEEFAAAFGNAKSYGWIEVRQEQGAPSVFLKDRDGAKKCESFIASLKGREVGESEVPAEYRSYAARLANRGVMKTVESKRVSLRITEGGVRAVEEATAENWVERVTPEVTARIRLTGVSPKLRPIDVRAPSSVFYPGRRHPVKEFINEVREVYLSMGFSEITGDSIQSSFWNFDALFTPQDHPARELQDTFYIKGGKEVAIKRAGVVAEVASVHENGGTTGSKGWRYHWNVEEAMRLVLRTHNTALTIRATRESGDRDTRVFSVGKVYRNESLDYKHLAELHQMEGIVIGEKLNLRDLMGVLTKFYAKLGMSKVKLWPSYFPYTEPSMQVMVYYDKVGKWLEMGGSGLFRPEVTIPLGVKKPVIAWGCGLERLLMLRLGVEDIRELYNSDFDWLRRRREIASP